MRTLRAIIRLAGFALLTGAVYVARLFFRSRRSRDRIFRAWARNVARLVGMRITVKGRPPQGAFLLVSNHLSYVDIALLASQLDCIFVAKRDVRAWPFLGPIVNAMDTIFIDRERPRDLVRVNSRLARALATGEGIVVFAEGTSTRGETVLPLQPSLLEFAAQREWPVHYATVTYGNPAICWYGDMTFGGHFFAMLKLPRFDATVRFGLAPIADTDRKRLARRLHHAICELFTPVVAPAQETPWPTPPRSSPTTFATSNKR